uniref:Uncharacterized protein n=1 Tax=Romanomermis culicivorax TaxID=13658 RepID=A0A915K2G5_ROMCU
MSGHPSHRVATFPGPIATFVAAGGSRKSTLHGGERERKGKQGIEKDRKKEKREDKVKQGILMRQFALRASSVQKLWQSAPVALFPAHP